MMLFFSLGSVFRVPGSEVGVLGGMILFCFGLSLVTASFASDVWVGVEVSVSMTAIVLPTGTVSPSLSARVLMMPFLKLWTSMTALSLSTSAMTSPDLTLSPGLTFQLTSFPSVIESESCGMTIS